MIQKHFFSKENLRRNFLKEFLAELLKELLEKKPNRRTFEEFLEELLKESFFGKTSRGFQGISKGFKGVFGTLRAFTCFQATFKGISAVLGSISGLYKGVPEEGLHEVLGASWAFRCASDVSAGIEGSSGITSVQMSFRGFQGRFTDVSRHFRRVHEGFKPFQTDYACMWIR